MQHIADGRARGRRHQADPLRIGRQRPFPLRRKQPGGGELLLELFKRRLQRADALQLHRPHDQLILPARLIYGHLPLQQHLLTVGQQLARGGGRAAKQHTTQLRPGVLEREIHMTRTLRPQVGDLPAHPDLPHRFFQQPLHLPGQLADAQHLAQFLLRKQFAEVPLRFDWFAHQV